MTPDENLLEAAAILPADQVTPRCIHFGACGGCQLQMQAYGAQLEGKRALLQILFADAGLRNLPSIEVHPSPEPYDYRNRIRLRLQWNEDGELALGYNRRGGRTFLPITMCPIAAPLLLRTAEALRLALQQLAGQGMDDDRLVHGCAEAELFCNPDESRVQLTLFLPGRPPRDPAAADRFATGLHTMLQARMPELAGVGLVRLDAQSGRALGQIAGAGAAGLAYPVGEETYWVTRGGFFQVNRFLLPSLVQLVCGERRGGLAWDLFAGVGLFSRVLAHSFDAVTAVEGNPVACADLRAALGRIGPRHQAVEGSIADFLRRAVLERDRPELVVLDPPRAGAGEETCALLARLAPSRLVYLSCDATTLARDLGFLTQSGYRVAALHLIDLFPQTSHVETLAILDRGEMTRL